MVVTLSPIIIEVSPLQLPNAPPPILVTVFGIVTEVNPLQPLNAPFPIAVTGYVSPLNVILSGITRAPVGLYEGYVLHDEPFWATIVIVVYVDEKSQYNLPPEERGM